MSIVTFGEKLAITTIMYVFITSKESLACAVARLSSVLLLPKEARIFAHIVRNLLRCEKRGSAFYGISRKTKSYINSCWNSNWLTPL